MIGLERRGERGEGGKAVPVVAPQKEGYWRAFFLRFPLAVVVNEMLLYYPDKFIYHSVPKSRAWEVPILSVVLGRG